MIRDLIREAASRPGETIRALLALLLIGVAGVAVYIMLWSMQ